jgi:hypothetical protein
VNLRRFLWTLTFTSCAEEGPPDCAIGFEPGPGDHCYEVVDDETEDTDDPPPPTEETIFADLLASLPPCEPIDPNGLLDLDLLCAGPFCVDMPFGAMIMADESEPPQCEPDQDDDVSCRWPSWDVTAWFWDQDLDGVIEAEQLTTGIYVDPGFPGATDEGLGNGVSVACFIDVYGVPSSLEPLEYYGVDLWIVSWSFDGFRFSVYDFHDGVAYGGDGLVDQIWLNGPG